MYFTQNTDGLMTHAADPVLEPGRVYRTRELARWSANASRLATRLVREGRLERLGHGLYFHPKQSKFGKVPPTDAELMRAFLAGSPHVFTGSQQWNALGLGSTAVHAVTTVYNTKRSETVKLGGRRFALRRVAFPEQPTPEWYVVDLLEHAEEAGVSRAEVGRKLASALARGRFDSARLDAMSSTFGSQPTRELLHGALVARR